MGEEQSSIVEKVLKDHCSKLDMKKDYILNILSSQAARFNFNYDKIREYRKKLNEINEELNSLQKALNNAKSKYAIKFLDKIRKEDFSNTNTILLSFTPKKDPMSEEEAYNPSNFVEMIDYAKKKELKVSNGSKVLQWLKISH
ncbi:MAG: hypothetical protein ACTSWY_04245 [Promethearchaeota archaeon]